MAVTPLRLLRFGLLYAIFLFMPEAFPRFPMSRTLAPPRLSVTPRQTAMASGRCLLTVEVEMPLGFHCLPAPAQADELHEALTRADRALSLRERQTA